MSETGEQPKVRSSDDSTKRRQRQLLEQARLPISTVHEDPDLQEFSRDVVSEAWNTYREYGPADLQVLHDHAKEREDALKKFARHYKDRGNEEAETSARRRAHEYRLRAHVLYALLGRRLRTPVGQEIPPFDEAGGTVLEERFRQVPKRTLDYLAAAAQYINEAETINWLCLEVAEDLGVSESTAYKWLCDQNPLYQPGRTVDERYEAMRDIISDFTSLLR